MCGFVPTGAVAVEAPRAEAVDDLAHQELAQQFRLDNLLGHGTATAVYRAREQGSNRHIVVKVLVRPVEGRAEADERFRRAVEAVAALEHPHIVPVFGHGCTEHLYWYSMENVHGRSLRNFLLSRGPLDMKACQRVVAQVASALDHAHRRGIVHGALKPENVLIDAEGWVHVCDPLVTRALEPPAPPARPSDPKMRGQHPQEAPKKERSPYIAPEDLTTPLADQYALAVLVYECLAGSPPPEPCSADVAPASLLAGTRPDIPPHVTHAVRRALSPKPIDRFPGVLDFVAALETYSLSVPDARPSGRVSSTVLRQTDWKPPERPLKHRLVIGAAVVVVAALALLLLRPAAERLLRRTLERTPPGPVAVPVTDSTAPALQPADTAPRPVTLPPGRVARRQGPTAERPAPDARRTETPRPRGQRAAPSAGTPARAGAAAPAAGAEAGSLFVNAAPWGQLYVDGQLVGNTPKANLSLAPGPHTIRVVREGFEPFERAIQVAPGQVVRLTDIVLVERRP
jgi:serine/threonine-protein kinase